MDTATFAHPNATPRTLAVVRGPRRGRRAAVGHLAPPVPHEARRPAAAVRAGARPPPYVARRAGHLVDAARPGDLEATGALPAHSEGIIDLLAQSETAEVAMLLKEQDDGTTRLSVRTKPGGVDATVLTGTFGGGGHARAAGATIALPLDEAAVAVVRRGRAPGRGRQPVSRRGRSRRARRRPDRRQAVGADVARRRRPRPAPVVDPPGRPRRDARPVRRRRAAGVPRAARRGSSSTTSASTKRYRATICFGERSTTDDIDGERTPVDGPAGHARRRRCRRWPRSPGRSARSRPTTARSRSRAAGRTSWPAPGEPVELAPREVTIHALDARRVGRRRPRAAGRGRRRRAARPGRTSGRSRGTSARTSAPAPTSGRSCAPRRGGFRLEDAIAARRPARPRGRRTGGHRRDPPADRRRPRGPARTPRSPPTRSGASGRA